MNKSEDNVELTITINKKTYDVLKAIVPFCGAPEITPEILASAYVEERINGISKSIGESAEAT